MTQSEKDLYDDLQEYGMTRRDWNKLKYGWSKWGEPNYGLVQKNLTDEWYCQCCNRQQSSHLPSFMFEFGEREFVRICSLCQNTKLEMQLTTFGDLIKVCRISLHTS